MLEQYIAKRLEFIAKMANTFKTVLEPDLPKKFRRGIIQGQIFKIHNLPRTGENMKICNEAIMSLGYIQVKQDGWSMFKKVER